MAAIRQMTDDDIEKISHEITRWPVQQRITWDGLRVRIAILLKFETVDQVWTRQQLPKYLSIKTAYEIKNSQHREWKKKQEGKCSKSGEEKLTIKEKAMADRIQTLLADVERLQGENDSLHDKFTRWQYNATQASAKKRLSMAELDSPLPNQNQPL